MCVLIIFLVSTHFSNPCFALLILDHTLCVGVHQKIGVAVQLLNKFMLFGCLYIQLFFSYDSLLYQYLFNVNRFFWHTCNLLFNSELFWIITLQLFNEYLENIIQMVLILSRFILKRTNLWTNKKVCLSVTLGWTKQFFYLMVLGVIYFSLGPKKKDYFWLPTFSSRLVGNFSSSLWEQISLKF